MKIKSVRSVAKKWIHLGVFKNVSAHHARKNTSTNTASNIVNENKMYNHQKPEKKYKTKRKTKNKKLFCPICEMRLESPYHLANPC